MYGLTNYLANYQLICWMKLPLLLLFLLSLFVFPINAQNDTVKVISWYDKSQVFEENSQSDSELVYLTKSLSLAEKLNFTRGISVSLGSLGTFYMHKGEYPKALTYYFRGLGIDEKNGNKKGILTKSGNIGIIYDNQGDFPKALEYYNKALSIARELNEKKYISIQFCNIAIVYSIQHKFDLALSNFEKALEMDCALNDKEGIARNLSNIGSVYEDSKRFMLSLEKHLQALKIAEEIDDKNIIVSCLTNIGWVNTDLKKYKVAEEYFVKALKISEEVDDLNLKSQMESILSDFYKESGNERLALQHYKTYISIRDSVYNEENTKKSVREEMNYDFEKKRAATKFEHDKVVYQLEADNTLQKQWRVFFITVIALAFIVLFFVKRAYDNKKRLTIVLEAEDQRKDVLLQEVHHRINNNLQIISSLLTLQANSAENEKLTEYLVQSQNRIQSLSALHELLYDTNSPLEINMEDYINKVLDFHRDVLQALPAKVMMESDIQPVKFPTKLAVPLALIVNELVTNSIKYAFVNKKEGLIKVSLKENPEGNSWQVTISDNGTGLPDESGKRKDSLGLKLVNIMTKQIGGVLTSKNENGAVFNVTFNLIKTK